MISTKYTPSTAHLPNTPEGEVAFRVAQGGNFQDFYVPWGHVVTQINDLIQSGQLNYTTRDGKDIPLFVNAVESVRTQNGLMHVETARQDILSYFDQRAQDAVVSCWATIRIGKLYDEVLYQHDEPSLKQDVEAVKKQAQEMLFFDIPSDKPMSLILLLERIGQLPYPPKILSDLREDALTHANVAPFWESFNKTKRAKVQISPVGRAKFTNDLVNQTVISDEYERLVRVMEPLKKRLLSLVQVQNSDTAGLPKNPDEVFGANQLSVYLPACIPRPVS